MEMQPTRLRGPMSSAVEVCAHRAFKKQIHIEIDCADDLTASINPPLIEQALINLIGNAVKYSDDGKTVTVRASKEQRGLMLSVKDQGYGIASEHLERLFERFYRADLSRNSQGSGLGLSIVKQLVELHGGQVGADYHDNRLSIWFQLPRENFNFLTT